ncbi:hypothetical protein BFR04_05165 [Gaetbulibacter sp. 4G1]|nr:TonB-dependent receptor plug domain-containing protein [Gaetbulibacter sp. 4G1]PIA78913.1 hypothetical protein BFR04_05165 [Gaetbulibacter sp. 4G1]
MKPIFTSLSSAWINLIFVLLSLSAFSYNTDSFINNNESKNISFSKEKIYIHFDKTFYNQGDDIWYKIYLVNAINHEPESLSKVVYVDLIGPNHTIIETKTIKINAGTGNGDFKLPTALPNGEYTIRAYTNFMRNFDDSYFFVKKIYLNTVKSNHSFNTNTTPLKPHISFSPEGGNLVSGFLNRIVVKATKPLRKGEIATGEVFDDTNNKVLHFETSELGLGSFQFIPQKGRTYTAIVSLNGEKNTYSLPPVKDNSATIRIDKTYNGYRVNVYSSLLNGMDNFELLGMQKGDIVCRAKLNGENAEVAIDIPKSDLEQGLIQFQLLNKNGTILSDEIAFIDTNNLDQKVTLTPLKETFEKNDIAEIEINFDQLLEENIKANMSISVTQVNPSKNDASDLDIKSHLLLNPEIRDNIEQFDIYSSNDLNRKKILNQLLISQDGKLILSEDTPKNNELKFSPESGLNLKGTVKEIHKGKPVKASVTVTYKNGNEIGHDKTVTDDLGRFSFDGLNFDERTFVAIKAKRLKASYYSKDFIIVLDSTIPPQHKYASTSNGNIVLDSKIEQNKNIGFAPQKGEVKLDKVKINAIKKRLDRFSKKRKASLYLSPSHTLDFKNLRISPSANNPIQALQGKFPGVHVIGDNITLRGRNSLTGNNEPLFLLDGLPTDRDQILSLPIFDIDFIDVIQAVRASVYGSRGGGGIIAVYTVDGSEENEEKNNRNVTTSFYHPGFYQARKFNQDENNSSTLYWNPDLKLNPSENTKITFNTANKSATYKVLLEGITSNGTPFKSVAYFDVN